MEENKEEKKEEIIEENKEEIVENNIKEEHEENKEEIKDNSNLSLLSYLFKECKNENQINNFGRMKSISFSDIDADNFRNNFFDIDVIQNESFSNLIIKRLDKIKKCTIANFNNQINKFNKYFEDFKNQISVYIIVKEKNMENLANNERIRASFKKYSYKNIFKKINNMIEIYDNIINNIEKNFELLNKFCEQDNLIYSKNQLENFLINNYQSIEKCSLINQFNFTQIDTLNLFKIDYYKNYFSYLSQKKINIEESAKNYIINKDEVEAGAKFVKENFYHLEQLKIEGIDTEDFGSIIKNIESNINKNKKYNLSKFCLQNFNSIEDISTNIKLNKVRKVKIRKSPYINFYLISKIFLQENKNLISLSLEHINFTDIGFRVLIPILIANPYTSQTLENLSLEGNRITVVKYDAENAKIQDRFFQNLKYFNLSKNLIYKFEFFLNALPKLKFLDLTSNNIPTGSFMDSVIKLKDKLVLLNDNMFITNSQNNNIKYIKYLSEKLPTFDTEIKNLNLNFTYDIEKQTHLEKLKLSTIMSITLIKLDISFCGISTDVIVNFFKNNSKFLSLRHLNLRYNNIKGDFFEKMLDNEEICLDNLNFIDLSENEIICNTIEKTENLAKFIKKYQNFENIQLINSGFFSDWINNIKDINLKGEKFKEIYLSLKKYLEDNKREFKFITNEGNQSFVKKEFHNFFSFKF